MENGENFVGKELKNIVLFLCVMCYFSQIKLLGEIVLTTYPPTPGPLTYYWSALPRDSSLPASLLISFITCPAYGFLWPSPFSRRAAMLSMSSTGESADNIAHRTMWAQATSYARRDGHFLMLSISSLKNLRAQFLRAQFFLLLEGRWRYGLPSVFIQNLPLMYASCLLSRGLIATRADVCEWAMSKRNVGTSSQRERSKFLALLKLYFVGICDCFGVLLYS